MRVGIRKWVNHNRLFESHSVNNESGNINAVHFSLSYFLAPYAPVGIQTGFLGSLHI